jgi:hypothetical protein
MKALRKLSLLLSGICLMIACSKGYNETPPLKADLQTSKTSQLNASEVSLEWHGAFAGSTFKIESVITTDPSGFARIRHIPEWITIEDDNSNALRENTAVTNNQSLWIYPVCKNTEDKRCDAIEIEDLSGNKLQISVSQCGCDDMPNVSVKTFIEEPPSNMTITNETGYTNNGSSSITIQFTPVNPNYGYNVNFNADYYVYKQGVLTGSGQWVLLNRLENNRTLIMSETAKAGDKIMVTIGEHRMGEADVAGDKFR